MNDAQDNDIPPALVEPVGHNKIRLRDDQFPCPIYPAQSAHFWEQQEIIDRICNALIYLKGGNHIILGDMIHNRIAVAKGLVGPL
jgi:hypothetical protein